MGGRRTVMEGPWKVMEGWWKVMEGWWKADGRLVEGRWKVMEGWEELCENEEGHGRSWKVMARPEHLVLAELLPPFHGLPRPSTTFPAITCNQHAAPRSRRALPTLRA